MLIATDLPEAAKAALRARKEHISIAAVGQTLEQFRAAMTEKYPSPTYSNHFWIFPTLVKRVGKVVYAGAIDISRGFDLLWDEKVWHVSTRGIFTDTVIFLSEYYGFPETALFVRV